MSTRELSAARRALTAGPTAPGTDSTLQELRDPSGRPPKPYQPTSQEVLEFQDDQPVELKAATEIRSLRQTHSV